MKNLSILSVVLFHCFSCMSQTNIPSDPVQIKTALMAAPADKKEGAAVYGYTQSNELKLLQKGTNELICLADDPVAAGFSVACYHQSLEPFMKRGRDLKKEGKSTEEIFAIREKEVKEGKLKMPKEPTTLFVYS